MFPFYGEVMLIIIVTSYTVANQIICDWGTSAGAIGKLRFEVTASVVQ
jgi:hypothetical protein